MAYCTNCGFAGQSGDRFCGNCGSELGAPDETERTPTPPAPAPPPAAIPPPLGTAPSPGVQPETTPIGTLPTPEIGPADEPRTGPTRRTLMIWGAAAGLLVVAAVGLILALVNRSGDPVAQVADPSELPQSVAASQPGSAVGFGSPEVSGSPLPAYDPLDDAEALGQPAPTVSGQGIGGLDVQLGPDGPAVVVFVSHWCEGCDRQLANAVESTAAGIDSIARLFVVASGTNPRLENYPPDQWLDARGWSGPTVMDDEQASVADAFGVSEYPFTVALDADWRVVARHSERLAAESLLTLAERTVATEPPEEPAEVEVTTETVAPPDTAPALTTAPTPPPIEALAPSRVSVVSSSHLPAAGTNLYTPEMMFDGDLATAWNHCGSECTFEGSAREGVGQQLSFVFDEPITLVGFEIANGYQKIAASGADRFLENNRVETLEITTANSTEVVVLDDRRGYQTIWIDPTLTDFAVFDVVSVYTGNRYNDLAISELVVLVQR